MADIEILYCPACARENLAEAPPCVDGHDNCPDRACVECGTALVLDAGLIALISPEVLISPDHAVSVRPRRIA